MKDEKPRQKPGIWIGSHARHYVDIDYWGRLSPEEAAWLKQFVREFYAGDTHRLELHSQSEKKALNRQNYVRKNDLLTKTQRRPVDGCLPLDEETAFAETLDPAIAVDLLAIAKAALGE